METVLEQVEVGSRRLEVERPADPEALIDETAFADDEFLPYWAESWPSGLALARLVAEREVRGVDVLELGCGLGLPSLTAASAGARVVAIDWAAPAIALLGRNAERNGVAVEGLVGDWRDPSLIDGRRRFGLVLAADVLYERRNVEPVARLLGVAVAPDGEALVADPGRTHTGAFLAAVRADGWSHEPLPSDGLARGAVHRLWRDRH